MRVIFYVLVLANLLYLGWAEWIDVPAPPTPSSIAALPRLQLVSDLPPAKRAALARKMSLQAPPAQCVSVGPFDDPAIAAQAAAVLKAKSFAPQQRAAQSAAIRRFWVYLDGFKTDAAEMRVLHRLERAGIDDAEAMPADAGGRKVSLGLFSDRDHAGHRAKVAKTLGLKPAMTERMLPGTVYWLDLTLRTGSAAVPLKDVSGLESGGGGSAIGMQPCPTPSSSPAPSQQAASPPASPTPPPEAVPKGAIRASAPVQAAALPACRPGGGGPVPCVLKRATTHPSVL